MAWLLLLTLALRALLAPGIMPAFAGEAGPVIEICTQMLPPADAGDGPQHADHVPCLFAAAGFVNLGAVAAPALVAPLQWALAPSSLPVLTIVPDGRPRAVSAWGPPAIKTSSFTRDQIG